MIFILRIFSKLIRKPKLKTIELATIVDCWSDMNVVDKKG